MAAERYVTAAGRVGDWGRAQDPLMRACFLVLRAIDGFPNTRDHAAGRLPALIAAAGLAPVARRDRLRTVWGTFELLDAPAGDTPRP
jgi:hypothetical protein